ncbi:restriction endonuclease subunit S [Vibrio artabrorum]|uniref:restriction endonuclease subunit S n=1 Tax=Vibrio artabrorum TaxID=446374 RepID=UPI00354F2AB7
MSELPRGWVETKLPNFAELIMGQSPASSDCNDVGAGIPFFQGKAEFQKLYPEIRKFCTKPKKTAQKEDVLFSVRAPVGPTNLASEDCAIGRGLSAIRAYEQADRYLLQYFRSIEPWMSQQGTGSTFKAVSGQFLKELDIKVAPLAEQKRIVEKLDEALAQVGTIKARLDSIPNLLKRFRQSVLASAVSGKLTEEWRGDHNEPPLNLEKIQDGLFEADITKGNFGKKNARASFISEDEAKNYPSSYPLVRVGGVVGCIVPNRDKPKSFSGGTSWILTPDLKEQSISLASQNIEQGLSTEEIEKYNARVIPKNSVIMTCVGRLGLSAVNDFECVINQQLHAFLSNEFVHSSYLAFVIRAYEKYFYGAATSTTVQYLNKTSCNSMPLPLPSFTEQKEIVRLVDQYFAFANTIEAQVKKAQVRVDNLTQSILAKAFRGELVPQDPNDESADKLLERIAKAREEAEALAKAAKKAEVAKKRAAKA